MAGKNVKEVYDNMLRTNPEFKDFVKKNQGKSLEDMAMEYDIDLSILKEFF